MEALSLFLLFMLNFLKLAEILFFEMFSYVYSYISCFEAVSIFPRTLVLMETDIVGCVSFFLHQHKWHEKEEMRIEEGALNVSPVHTAEINIGQSWVCEYMYSKSTNVHISNTPRNTRFISNHFFKCNFILKIKENMALLKMSMRGRPGVGWN